MKRLVKIVINYFRKKNLYFHHIPKYCSKHSDTKLCKSKFRLRTEKDVHNTQTYSTLEAIAVKSTALLWDSWDATGVPEPTWHSSSINEHALILGGWTIEQAAAGWVSHDNNPDENTNTLTYLEAVTILNSEMFFCGISSFGVDRIVSTRPDAFINI